MTRNFEEIYKDLGIKTKDLPPNYDPDTYARQLMKDVAKGQDVSYAVSTTLISDKEEPLETRI